MSLRGRAGDDIAPQDGQTRTDLNDVGDDGGTHQTKHRVKDFHNRGGLDDSKRVLHSLPHGQGRLVLKEVDSGEVEDISLGRGGEG